jgi:RNA polymerase sigma factor (sigma-70 family)
MKSTAPIDRIIKQCLENDRKAQKELFELLSPLLMAVSVRYTPKNCDPLDNLQDAFLRIFQNLKSFDPSKGELKHWAKRIVIHCALDKLKLSRNIFEQYDGSIPEQVLGEDIHHNLALEELHAIIAKLPDGYRQVFCMYEIEGYSHREIAEILQIHETNSRVQLSRGKKILQEILTTNQYQLGIKN